MKKFCEEIAVGVWNDLARSNLITAEKLGEVPEISFDDLGNKFLGMAYGDHIELHENYLQNNEKEKLKMTLLHELAHVAEYRCSGIMGHGPLWHAICLYIGGNGDARGDLPEAGNPETNDILFGVSAIIALAGALFTGMYCAHFLGIDNKIAGGICGIGGVVLSLVLWAECCKTFEQVKVVAVIQALSAIIFITGVLL